MPINPDDFTYATVDTPLGVLVATCTSNKAFTLTTYSSHARRDQPNYPSREQAPNVARSIDVHGVNMTIGVNIVRGKTGDFVVSGAYGNRADRGYKSISDSARDKIEAKIALALPSIVEHLTDTLAQAGANVHRRQVKEARQAVADAENALADAREHLAALTATD